MLGGYSLNPLKAWTLKVILRKQKHLFQLIISYIYYLYHFSKIDSKQRFRLRSLVSWNLVLKISANLFFPCVLHRRLGLLELTQDGSKSVYLK